jgi:hypothetical protein
MKIVAIAAVLAAAATGCDASMTRCAHVASPVSLEGERSLTVRTVAGSVWVSPHAWSEPRRAWSTPAKGAVEDLQIEALPAAGGFQVTFEQAGVRWSGELDATRAVRGPLRALPAEPPPAPDASVAAR